MTTMDYQVVAAKMDILTFRPQLCGILKLLYEYPVENSEIGTVPVIKFGYE